MEGRRDTDVRRGGAREERKEKEERETYKNFYNFHTVNNIIIILITVYITPLAWCSLYEDYG